MRGEEFIVGKGKSRTINDWDENAARISDRETGRPYGERGSVGYDTAQMLTFEPHNRSVTKSQSPSDKPNSASGHDKRTSPVSFSRNSNLIRTTRLEATFK